MPFTVQQIKTMAETFTDTTVDITNQKAVDAMKLALNIIADRNGYNFEIPAAEYTGNVWNANVLPEDNLGVTVVNINDGCNTVYEGYQVRGRDILFYDSGSYIIHYRKLPDEPTAIDSVLTVHPIYKTALWEFMIGYVRLSKWEGEDNFGIALKTEFEARIAEGWRKINSHAGPKQLAVVRHA